MNTAQHIDDTANQALSLVSLLLAYYCVPLEHRSVEISDEHMVNVLEQIQASIQRIEGLCK